MDKSSDTPERGRRKRCKRQWPRILDSFGEPVTILEYIECSGVNIKLIGTADTPRFKKFIETTLVIVDQERLPVMRTEPSFDMGHKEVVIKVVNKLSRTNFRNMNVLTLGVKQSSFVSITATNNSNLVMTPYWHTLYWRIGDELMIHLLSETSIFVLATKAYIQVTGIPIYNQVPRTDEYMCLKQKRETNKTEVKVKVETERGIPDVKVVVASTSHYVPLLQNPVIISGKKRKINETDMKIVDETERGIPENDGELTKQHLVESTSYQVPLLQNPMIISGKKRKTNETDMKIVDETERDIPENDGELTKQHLVASTSHQVPLQISESLVVSGKKRKAALDDEVDVMRTHIKRRKCSNDETARTYHNDPEKWQEPDDTSVTSGPNVDVLSENRITVEMDRKAAHECHKEDQENYDLDEKWQEPDDTSVTSGPNVEVPSEKSVEMDRKAAHECRKEDQENDDLDEEWQEPDDTSVASGPNVDVLSENRITVEMDRKAAHECHKEDQENYDLDEKWQEPDDTSVTSGPNVEVPSEKSVEMDRKAAHECRKEDQENDDLDEEWQEPDDTSVALGPNVDVLSENRITVEMDRKAAYECHKEDQENHDLDEEWQEPDDTSVTSGPNVDVPSEKRVEMDKKAARTSVTSRTKKDIFSKGRRKNDRSYLPILICYNKSGNEKFSKSSILEKVASPESLRDLLILIFFIGKKPQRSKVKRVPKRYLKVEELLKQFLKKHQTCSTLKLLDLYCPVPDYSDGKAPSTKLKRKGNGQKACRQYPFPDNFELLIGMSLSKDQVLQYVKSRLLQVVPLSMWGSKSNRNTFLRFVGKFLSLGRREKIDLQELVCKIKVTDCKWVFLDHETSITKLPLNTVKKQEEMVVDLFHWLMKYYAMVLLETSFYITEIHSSRNMLMFYRKVVFNEIQRLALQAELKSGTFKPISKADAKLYLAKTNMGVSNMRFVPKKSSCRPIVNTRSSRNKTQFSRCSQQNLFDVLSYITNHPTASIGSSLGGFCDIHKLWKDFAVKHRGSSTSTEPLYFVKTDIMKCFDSILPNKLLAIVSTAFNKFGNIFVVNQYAVGSKRRKEVVIQHKRIAMNMSDYRTDYITLLDKDNYSKNSVLINKVRSKFLKAEDLLGRLRMLLMYDVIKASGSYYLRTCGIGQGSILSSMLTRIYYDYMEKSYLNQVSQDGIMLRLVDDFLLVTPHCANAERFLNVMLTGIEVCGCKVRFDKTLTNFPFTYNGQAVKSTSGLFPWCGILINPETLELSSDYSCYADVDLRYSMTISRNGPVFEKMERKLYQSMLAKNEALFLDPVINKKETCLKNIYEIFLLLADRFHSYQSTLPEMYKPQQNPKAFKNLLCHLFVRLYKYTKRNLYRSKNDPVLSQITRSEFIWLGCEATIQKVQRHRALYKKLITLLRKQKQGMGITNLLTVV